MEPLLEVLNLKQNIPIAISVLVLGYLISKNTSEFVAFKSDTKENFKKLENDIKEVRAELKTDIRELNVKIDSVSDDLKSDIKEVRDELNLRIDSVRNELSFKFDKLSNDVINLDKAVIRFESHRDAESKFEKMISDAITNKLLSERKSNTSV